MSPETTGSIIVEMFDLHSAHIVFALKIILRNQIMICKSISVQD